MLMSHQMTLFDFICLNIKGHFLILFAFLIKKSLKTVPLHITSPIPLFSLRGLFGHLTYIFLKKKKIKKMLGL
jgi:hypothetical protein